MLNLLVLVLSFIHNVSYTQNLSKAFTSLAIGWLKSTLVLMRSWVATYNVPVKFICKILGVPTANIPLMH